jgi:hypothetical protein
MRGAFTSALIAAGFALFTAPASADGTPIEASTDVEVYNQRGEVNGCGLSFLVVWLDDSHRPIGVNGSATLLADLVKNSVIILIKAAGAEGANRVKLTYAWLETPRYGRTADFKPSPSEDGLSFIGGKPMDEKSVTLPYDMALSGFKLGITRTGSKIDDVVLIPSTPGKAQGV